MRANIYRSLLSGEVKAVPSKSYLHRAIILAAFCHEPTEICGFYPSEDVLATVDCVRRVGATVIEEGDSLIILPIKKAVSEGEFFCGESASTLRFFMPIAAGLGKRSRFFVGEGLSRRPLESTLDMLRRGGVTVNRTGKTIEISGRLKSEEIVVDGEESSQTITAALLYAAVFNIERVVVTGRQVSQGYIDITVEVLRRFGIEIVVEEKGVYRVRGSLHSPGRTETNGDWSNAAVFMAMGLCGHDAVTVTGLKKDCQPDRVFCKTIIAGGGRLEFFDDGVTAYPSNMEGLDCDCRVSPDLAPVLAATACFCRGESRLRHTERLRGKETDRLSGIVAMLDSVGIGWRMKNDELTIYGGAPKIGVTSGNNDHRLIQAAVFIGLSTGGVVTDIDGIKKSFPDFFEKIKQLGGRYELTV